MDYTCGKKRPSSPPVPNGALGNMGLKPEN